MQYRRICVFCRASNDVTDEYKGVASIVAKALGEMRLEIIYGGSTSRLMGIIAATAKQHGARIVGVFPKLIENREAFNHDVDESIVVETLFIRKEIMIDRSDAFLILPGGIGTLDELFEVLTIKSLDIRTMLNKPIWIFNPNQFWQPLYVLLENIMVEKFAAPRIKTLYEFIPSVEQLIAKIKS